MAKKLPPLSASELVTCNRKAQANWLNRLKPDELAYVHEVVVQMRKNLSVSARPIAVKLIEYFDIDVCRDVVARKLRELCRDET